MVEDIISKTYNESIMHALCTARHIETKPESYHTNNFLPQFVTTTIIQLNEHLQLSRSG